MLKQVCFACLLVAQKFRVSISLPPFLTTHPLLSTLFDSLAHPPSLTHTHCRGNNEDFLIRCTKYAEKRRWGHLVQAFHTALAKVAAVPETPKTPAQQLADASTAGASATADASATIGVSSAAGESGKKGEGDAQKADGGQQRESKRRKVAASAATGGEGPAAAELRAQVCVLGLCAACCA